MKKFLLLTPNCLWVIIGSTVQVTSVDVITIGSRLEPFVDKTLIERMTGVELVLHQDVPREVALIMMHRGREISAAIILCSRMGRFTACITAVGTRIRGCGIMLPVTRKARTEFTGISRL